MTLDNFRFGGEELRPQHTPLINQIALMAAASRDTSCPVGTILVKGFTDSVEHTVGYNVVLGLRRALSVKDGITAAIRALDPAIAAAVIFVPTTFGAAQPVGPNATPAGRAKNRRVEVTLQPI
jgi:outer membrane protein OmpA-like peptidoglycan-associated protein